MGESRLQTHVLRVADDRCHDAALHQVAGQAVSAMHDARGAIRQSLVATRPVVVESVQVRGVP